MIEIEDLAFGGRWLRLNDKSVDVMTGSYLLEQLYAQMMGWA